jgi:hypothetical protein
MFIHIGLLQCFVVRLRVCGEIAVYVLKFPAVSTMTSFVLSHGTRRHIEVTNLCVSAELYSFFKAVSRVLCQQGSYIPQLVSPPCLRGLVREFPTRPAKKKRLVTLPLANAM